MKKFFALLLTVAMVLSLGFAAFAADGSTITVTDAKIGETYNLYKIFDLSVNADKSAFTYTLPSDSEWISFFTNGGAGTQWFQYNATSRLVTKLDSLNESTVSDFAKAALAYAKQNTIDPDKTVDAETTSVVFDGLDMGYYLIDTTVGSAVILHSNHEAVEVQEKSAGPQITKTVQEDKTGIYGASDTADINQVVNYMVEITNTQKLHHVDMKDSMSSGLTFDRDSVKVYLNSVSENNLITADDGGTLYTGNTWYLVDAEDPDPDSDETHLGDDTFHIHFRDALMDTLSSTDKIIVTYSATLNDDAVIAGEGNPNEVYLAYGNAQKTEKSIVKTYTYELPVFKYTGTNTPLAGAKFTLMEQVQDGNRYVAAIDENGKISEWTTDQTQAYQFVSGTDGYIKITGLDSSVYSLTEVEAPAGYNKITTPIIVTIAENGTMTNASSQTISTLRVLNNTGTELPSTGGIGTTIFIVVGMLGVLVLGVFLVTNRRMKKEVF